MTHFDKIRKMSPKEMAIFFKKITDIDFDDYCENHPSCDPCSALNEDKELNRDELPCEGCIERWLCREVM